MRFPAFLGALLAVTSLFLSLPAASADDAARGAAVAQAAPPDGDVAPWRDVNSGIASIPGSERGVVIQARGKAWRALRPPVVLAGGVLLALSLGALVAFYLWRGPIGVSAPPTGRLIERFAVADRFAHWTMGIGFVVLGLTGLILAGGRRALLPLVGYDAFSWLAIVSKNLHAFLGPLFLVCLAYFIVRFARDNLPRRHDVDWLLKFGGMFSRQHVPSGRFNAGEKTLFWGLVCFFCIVLGVTGLALDFPNWAQGRSLMQTSSIIHLVIGFFAICASLFHMYLGTVGLKGALHAMVAGVVDESWAREHHEIWFDEVKAGKSRQHYVEPAHPAALAPAGDD